MPNHKYIVTTVSLVAVDNSTTGYDYAANEMPALQAVRG